MYSEAKKIHIAGEVLKVSSSDVLNELESILKKSAKKSAVKKTSAHQFSGLLTKKDPALMEKTIQEGCETIQPDDWKQTAFRHQYHYGIIKGRNSNC